MHLKEILPRITTAEDPVGSFWFCKIIINGKPHKFWAPKNSFSKMRFAAWISNHYRDIMKQVTRRELLNQ